MFQWNFASWSTFAVVVVPLLVSFPMKRWHWRHIYSLRLRGVGYLICVKQGDKFIH
jgi:hypothetical protein